MPKISVIIPVYNEQKNIKPMLSSLFKQTLTDFEVIAVDDGSTDNSLQILEQDSRVKVIKQKNQGSPVARNRGFAASSAPFVIFCDADLVLESTMLERLYNALGKTPQASYAYCSFMYGAKKFPLWGFDSEKLKKMPYIHTSSLIRREHFPGFDEKLKRFQDWDLWLTMLEQNHTGLHVPEYLFTVKPGGTMSQWVPKIFYRLPFKTKKVKKYLEAEKIIKQKHKL